MAPCDYPTGSSTCWRWLKMLDWWEAAALSAATAGAGGLIGLVTAYATYRWTTTANRDSEERQAKRRAEEAQREAIRQIRRERIQPVVDYLALSKQFLAGGIMSEAVDRLELDPQEEERFAKAREAFRKEAVTGAPDMSQVTRAYLVAVTSALSIPALQEQLGKIHIAVAAVGRGDNFGAAMRSAEELIERYLAGAEPRQPTEAK